MKTFWYALGILAMLGTIGVVSPGEGSPLQHKFINPNFGGNAFNGQPLLNSATLQNAYLDEELDRQDEKSQLQNFEDRLNRSILSRLSRRIVDGIFGEEDGVPTGNFDTGDFDIFITEDLDGVTIDITDQTTGDATIIQVPFD
jgi:curli production assembly/transport component CsgF